MTMLSKTARRSWVVDAEGNEIELEDGQPVPPGCTVHVHFMDARAGVPPSGKYYLYDGAGRIAGLSDVQSELRRVGAAQDYGQRLANAHKLKCAPGAHLDHGKPDARNWYTDWLNAHGHM
jgi:hypothetical protein